MDFHQPLTSTEFVDRYNLLKPLADGAVRSLSAVATATGDVVMVHYLIGSSEANAAILAALERLPPADGKKVIEGFVIESNHVVVTHFLSGFTSLVDWLSHHDALFSTELLAAAGEVAGEVAEPPITPAATGSTATPPAPASPAAATIPTPPTTPATPAAPATPATKPPGEFTRLFGVGQTSEPQPTIENEIPPAPPRAERGATAQEVRGREASRPAAPAPASTSKPAPIQPPSSTPSSTQSPTPTPTPTPSPTPAPAATGAPAKSGPGEFTRLFGAYQEPTTTPPPPARPPRPAIDPPPPPPPSAVVPPIAPPPSLGRDGASLRPSGQPATPTTPPVPRAPAVVPVPGVAPIVPQPPAPLPPPIAQTPPPPAPAPLAGASAQSEYTRLIANATPATSPAVQPAAAPTAQPQPTAAPTDSAKSPSYLPLILTLNVVVLAAIGLVLYFVLRG